MRREELDELHYITLIENVPSICNRGILSHRRARRLTPGSVAMQVVQDIRAKKMVPGGRPLHEYANLYICARNPMLFKRLNHHQELCVLRVNTDVLDLPDVVITDGNAASKYARFGPSPGGLRNVDRERTFAEYWTDPTDGIQELRNKTAKCAEVLVPDHVPANYLIGAYVCCQPAQARFDGLDIHLTAEVNHHFFFNRCG